MSHLKAGTLRTESPPNEGESKDRILAYGDTVSLKPSLPCFSNASRSAHNFEHKVKLRRWG